MRIMFSIFLIISQVLCIYGQNNKGMESLRVLPKTGVWLKLEKNGAITDSIEVTPGVNYTFLEFNPNTGLIKVSYPQNNEWIQRGRGYLTLYDIQPFISRKILSYYTSTTGDSIPYKNYLFNLSQIVKLKKIASEKQQRSELNRLTKQYGKVNANLITENKIKIGMTKQMVIESWGKPEHISRTVTSSVVHEQWVYGNTYIYFDNGILTAWQD